MIVWGLQLCTICLRKGGACIQCRVPQCSAAFHVWCAHEKVYQCSLWIFLKQIIMWTSGPQITNESPDISMNLFISGLFLPGYG